MSYEYNFYLINFFFYFINIQFNGQNKNIEFIRINTHFLICNVILPF